MAEMLLINPRRRRRSTAKRAKTTKRRRTVRRSNPITTIAATRRRRPVSRRARRAVSRRRRNPISLGRGLSTSKITNMLKDALIGGAGSVGVDYVMGYVNNYLPASLQKTPGQVGVYDAVKAGVTVALGHFLSKPTKGLSQKAAAGALTVQFAELLKGFMPATMTGNLGWAVPAAVTQGINRVGPIRRPGISAYTRGSPMLNAYTRGSQLLSGSHGARQTTASREGFTVR